MRIAKGGWLRAGIALASGIVVLVISRLTGGALSVILSVFAGFFMLIAGFFIYFFRDPDREYPEGEGIVLSPADGRIMDIVQNRENTTIKIFMSPLDVHIQRAPVSGMIESVEYMPGKFLRAYEPAASLENEKNTIKMRDDKLEQFEVVQIAGIMARRIVCWVKENSRVSRGERIGMIKLGSQVNLKMPSRVRVQVKPGERVVAGVTVVGRE